MARRFRFLLPLFLLAVLAQVFAPVGAAAIMAASEGSQTFAPDCIYVGSQETTPRDRDTVPHHAPDDCCGFCQIVAATGGALPPALIGIANPPALFRIINRYAADAVPVQAYVGARSRARAPPAAI